MKYRKEIDGLRSVAVLPVIFFHAGFAAFSGGFVGVDVFFVISGYLITSIIVAELEQQRFSVLRFYERRARRILPALFLVLAACIPLAWQYLMPMDMADFAKSVVAVAAFASNVLFWQQSGYFDTASELKPLLHTWSLAVEEQFYVFFPLLLVLCWKSGRKAALGTVFAILLLSFALAEWGATRAPDATFYLLHTRAWELMLGALAALYLGGRSEAAANHASSRWGGAASLLGLALIAYSVFAFDRSVPFPGAYALAPTVGALLIILFAAPDNLAGKLLGSRLFVGIGLISYSAYLWHQPLLAYARHASLTEPGTGLLLGLCLASLGLAWFSWRFVETPFRDRRRYSRTSIFAFSAMGLVALTAFGMAGHLSDGFRSRWGAEFAEFQPENRNFFRYTGCASNPKKFIPPQEACSYGGDGEARIAVIGDSHARSLVYELSESAKKRGLKVTQFTYEGCPPILDVYRADQKDDHRCFENNKATFDYVAAHPSLEYVVLAARWPFYLERARFDNAEGGVEKGLPAVLDLVVDGVKQSSPEPQRVAGVQERMRATVMRYLAAGKKVIVVEPVPEVGWYVPDYLMKTLSRKGTLQQADGSTSYATYLARSKTARDTFEQLGKQENLLLVRPDQHLCNTAMPGRCITHLGSVPLYRDADHLSNAGVQMIVEDILREVSARGFVATPSPQRP